MRSRRSFLRLLGAGWLTPLAVDTGGSSTASTQEPGASAVKAFASWGGVLGVQLYSLRRQLERDVRKALSRVRDWGLAEVETAGFHGRTASAFADELKRAHLRATSMHVGYEQLRDDRKQVLADAKALGVSYVATAWIPHQRPFSLADAERAAADFAEWGRALAGEGLRFMYHLHGYELAPGSKGTLLEVLLQATQPDPVSYQMDVFWVVRGGGDPVAILRRSPGRFASLHLKDMARGTPVGDFTGSAPQDTNVALGTGMIDYRAVLRAARDAGVRLYYLEDESDRVLEQVPRSLTFLAQM
jgi:sugar phosphate isomerase/epimerase